MTRFAVLVHADAKKLFATRCITQGFDGLTQAALGTHVLFAPESQNQPLAVAGGFALLLLPYSIFGPFVGTLLDRWPRQRVIVAAESLRGLTCLAIAGLLFASSPTWALVVTVLASLGLGRLILAGFSAGLPHVVSGGHLVSANSLFPTSGNIFAAIGTFLGVGIMGLTRGNSAHFLLISSALGYLIAAVVATSIPKRGLGPSPTGGHGPSPTVAGYGEPAAIDATGTPLREILEALTHLRHNPAAWLPAGVVVSHRVAFGALTLSGLFMVRWQADVAEALGDAASLAAGAGVGALVAALAAPRVAGTYGRASSSAVMVLLSLVVPWCYNAAAISGEASWLVGGACVMGMAGQWIKISADTSLQRSLADRHLGGLFTLFDIALNLGLVSGFVLAALTISPSGFSGGLLASLTLILSLSLVMAVKSRRFEPMNVAPSH